MAPLERTLPSIALVTIILLFSSSASAELEELSDRRLLRIYLERTLDAVERSLLYIGPNFDRLNLDGLIGVREAQSKISVLVAYLWPSLPPNIIRRARQIVELASVVGDKSEEAVKRATPKYYAKSRPLVRPYYWSLMFPYRPINTSLIHIFPKDQTQNYTEKESDDCLAELFGTEGKVRCQISHTCWTRMTGKRYRLYSLTHEAFYLINGIHANCQREMEKAAQKYSGKSVTQLADYFCANIYSEALNIEKRDFPAEEMDLLMEQIGLCGDAGYMEIAKWKWLPLILSFQRPNGCFGILPGEEINPKNFDSHGYGKAKRSFVIRKRVEQRMSADGCLSHRISVALSALVAYVRRLMEHLALERN